MKIKKIITKDKSPTLYLPELDEHYHSINGALQESLHIFIDKGLKSILKNSINLLEIGLGTGLNVALTYESVKQTKQTIYYEAIEKYPLDMDIISKLQFNGIDQEFYNKIHTIEWGGEISLTKAFILKKINIDLKDFYPDKIFDLIYFDAFAPEKQPELWTEEIFDKLYKHTNNNGILVTYSSKGIVKKALRNVGYEVERLPGPVGKKHIIRATKK